jgi:hypothetical protein
MAHLTEMFYSDNEFDTTITFNGALTTAFVSSRELGVYAKGNAKHNPEDAYDQRVGMDLAVARARSRLYSKIAKRLAR